MDEKDIEMLVEGATESDNNVDNPVETVDYETLYKGLLDTVKELQAERNSLKDENEALRTQSAELAADTAKVRETNYTLARQLNIQQETQKSAEDYLADMFLKKGDS